jgi:hypothetical protein
MAVEWTRTPEQIEKDHRAAEMRWRSMTYAQIGEQFGVTRQAAHQMVTRAMADAPIEGIEAIKAMELQKLDWAERQAFVVAGRKHVVVTPSGNIAIRVVKTDNGYEEEEVEDDAPLLKAIDTLLKIQERRARLLGLNAPTNVRLETVNYDPDSIDNELAQFRAQFAGLGDTKALLDGTQGEAGATTS